MALLELYDEAPPQVYGYLLSRAGDHGLAEELTAETFLGAVDAARKRPDQPPTIAWLIGIARHELADHWRAAERERTGVERLGRSGPESEDPWEVRLGVLLAREVLAHDGLAVPEVTSMWAAPCT
jgi:RNA polymerase sigma-70 factor (ECF subfamily)